MKRITFIMSAALLLNSWLSFSQTISGGGTYSLSICNDNTVRAWGQGFYGELGNGTNSGSLTPVQMSGLTGITAVAAGWIHSVVLKNNGTVWVCGDNGQGQLGNGTLVDANIPQQVSGLTGVTAVAAGRIFTAALKNNGTVWNWGNLNGSGQTTTPVQVAGLTGVIAITCGGYHFLALKNNGTVWGWRENIWGQLGNGAIAPISTPVQMTGLTDVIAIAGGDSYSLALKNDGTVWAVGNNMYGQLGNGSTGGNITTAFQIPSLSGIVAITSGSLSSYALKNDGTMWAWGYNDYGELGLGDTLHRTSPTQITGLTGITAIEAGMQHCFVLKNDGTVRGWGYNSAGQIGNGTATNSNIPMLVNSLCPVSQGCNANFTMYPDAFIAHTYWIVNYSSGTSPLHYDWNWGDGSPHDTIAYPSHTYATGGFYSICLTITDSTGCSSYYCNTDSLARIDVSNAMVYVNVIAPVGIPENTSVSSLSVYPNPDSGEIQLTTGIGQAAIKLIEIYDLLGEVVLQVSLHGESKAILNVDALPAGVYFVVVMDTENNLVTKKIVKM